MQRGTSIGKHLVVSLFSRLCGYIAVRYRFLNYYGVLGLGCVGAVNTLHVDLIQETPFQVVLGHLWEERIHVAIHVILTPNVPHQVPLVRLGSAVMGVFAGSYAHRSDAHLYLFAASQGARTRLVVVVYDVYLLSFATVTSVATPVVHHVIAQVNPLVGLCGCARTKTRTA